MLVINLLLFSFCSSGSCTTQSHFLDCRGIRSAKNGRWVLVRLCKSIFGHLIPSKHLRMMWHSLYVRTQNARCCSETTQTERQSVEGEEHTWVNLPPCCLCIGAFKSSDCGVVGGSPWLIRGLHIEKHDEKEMMALNHFKNILSTLSPHFQESFHLYSWLLSPIKHVYPFCSGRVAPVDADGTTPRVQWCG